MKKLLKILYPGICPGCGNVLSYDKNICDKCREKIRYIEEPCCKKCGKPLEEREREYCYDCSMKTHEYEKGGAVFLYEDVKNSLYQFKYKNMREFSVYYAEEMVKRYGKMIELWQIDGMVPVPIHARKRRKRGFNQAELVAKELSRRVKIPCITDWIKRVKNTVPLKELREEERRANLEGAFSINHMYHKKRVLLIDDIYTTGSTIDSCAKVLKKAGCDNVYFLTVSIGREYNWKGMSPYS